MKVTYPALTQPLKTPDFWLLAIGSGLMAMHMTLAWRADEANIFGTGLLFWAAVASMIWQRREQLKLNSSLGASLLGLSLIAILLLKSASIPLGGKFLAVMPVMSGLGLALMASGFWGLRQYWGELLALFFLGAPKLLEPWLYDPSPLTARTSAFLLWYGGFEARLRNRVFIDLPQGGVEVYSACSGIETVIHLLGVAFLYILMFPTTRIQKIVIPLVAGTLGFVVNAIRVGVMAILVAGKQEEAFDYWHHGEGSLLFSILAVLLFGGFCWLLQRQESSPSPEIVTEEITEYSDTFEYAEVGDYRDLAKYME
ncbi:MAG: cyanoexosortase A [Oscillatoriales cyanobacterium RM1_1_9]|nr:cyanoexosortase A [Oscillatoriales cyanobacterium SM2_3_0]NJO46139.1 cyanoexosortase A [Oscillatoriales cyanobacterium RM2_1_1]NJO71536.1 cyanoexosortase A [Oscillatoriales cyanobacterium RM1_1_9]